MINYLIAKILGGYATDSETPLALSLIACMKSNPKIFRSKLVSLAADDKGKIEVVVRKYISQYIDPDAVSQSATPERRESPGPSQAVEEQPKEVKSIQLKMSFGKK